MSWTTFSFCDFSSYVGYSSLCRNLLNKATYSIFKRQAGWEDMQTVHFLFSLVSFTSSSPSQSSLLHGLRCCIARRWFRKAAGLPIRFLKLMMFVLDLLCLERWVKTKSYRGVHVLCCFLMISFAEEVQISRLARNALEVCSFSSGMWICNSSENCALITGHLWCFCLRGNPNLE